MTNHRTKLKTLLRELFQFDAADLDFGIYRIMNQRRAEIDDFVERGLLDAVAQEFALLQEGVVEEKREELDRVARRIRDTYHPGIIDEQGNLTLPEQFMQAELPMMYVRLQTEVKRATVSAEAEAEIFNALYTFFSRYYDQGDFVTKRRYSHTHKYAIPYNGEEVLLHWANCDQYYVKTADTLTDYAFVIASHDGYRVRFKLATADTEQDNVKGDQRYFLPVTESDLRGLGDLGGLAQYDEAGRELTLFFEYRPLTDDESATYGKTRIQEKIITAERGRLLAAVSDVTLRGLLATPPAGKEVSLLDLHLTSWTRKATSDYFIHKDLQGFLERELDFYLKNEVMRLDDLDTENAARAEQYLTKLVVIKRLARKIIAFLAQIEDFEKALFEKPKFVLASEWCVTLDRAPEDLLPQVAANDAQWAEWERLFGVQKPEGGESQRLAFLAEHPTLTVNTALYDVAFKDALLAALSVRDGGLEAQCDGLLIHGENFQALTLLQPAYRGKVECVYIDPPFNAQSSEILYKNSFKHSSWLSLIENRLSLSKGLLASNSVYIIAIDEVEQEKLGMLLTHVFPEREKSCITVVHNATGQQGANFSYTHEFAYFLYPSGGSFIGLKDRKDNPDVRPLRNVSKGAHLRADAANCFYPIYVKDGKIIGFGDVCDDDYHPAGVNLEREDGIIEVYPIDPQGVERKWVFARQTVESILDELEARLNELTGKWDIIRTKRHFNYKTVWTDTRYSANSYGSRILNEILPGNPFTFPKSIHTIHDCVDAALKNRSQGLVVDFFAGSGTTAHAVINLNREDGGERKYILVEQGGYFDTVLKPRIQKVIYAADWKNGQPVEGSEGSSHAFQYLRLESYEDTLDNLDLDTKAAPAGLFPPERDDYLLRYFLDHETRQSRLNVESFATPFDYQLRVRHDGVEARVGVDLVETANFLLGLAVQARRAYEHQGRTYRAVFGTAGDQSVVVIWRDTAGLDLEAEAAFIRQLRLPKSLQTSEVWEPDRVYVNGDSHVPNAQPIEAVFMNAMRGAATVRRGGS